MFMRNKKWSLLFVGAVLVLGSVDSRAEQKQVTAEKAMNQSNAVTEGLKTLQVGEVKITWIQDNAGEKLMPRGLFADASDELIDSLALQQGVPSSIGVFWMETQGTGILFDTGMGGASGHMLTGLRALGVQPEEVKYLYITHFHGDHIGGMLENGRAVFPNAQVYVSRVEYEAWMKLPAEQNVQVVETMKAYQDRLHLFEFGDQLPGGVKAMDASGHTPGHTVFQAGRVLVIADLIHGAALQLEHPEICASFDMDKKAAVAVRRHFLQYAKENGLTLAGMHLPAPGFKAW